MTLLVKGEEKLALTVFERKVIKGKIKKAVRTGGAVPWKCDA